MLEMVIAGGWVMIPILLCSVIAMAVVAERLWSLQRHRVLPEKTVAEALYAVESKKIPATLLREMAHASPLGKIIAYGLMRINDNTETLHDAVEEAGRHVVHDLEKYMNGLGTIAAIAPLLGLLGTVIGMIKVFTAITVTGVGDASALAGGISESLITTTFGLAVAIPALMAHRYLSRKIDGLAIELEQVTSQFVSEVSRILR